LRDELVYPFLYIIVVIVYIVNLQTMENSPMKKHLSTLLISSVIIAVSQPVRGHHVFSHEPTSVVTSIDSPIPPRGVAGIEADPQPNFTNKDATTPPLPIDIKYVYRHKGTNQFKILTEGSILYSGDTYKLIFTATETVYVYIFQIDSAEKIYRLFPMAGFKGVTVNNFNPVPAGKTHHIPAKDKSFVLDEQVGKETIYFIISRQPDIRLENQYQQILNAQRENNPEKIQVAQETLKQEIKSRGLGGISADPIDENGQRLSKQRQRFKMCEGCVKVLEFWHR